MTGSSEAMTISARALAQLASHYAQGMTSIRGRRVQRLLKREFAGAKHVLIMNVEIGPPAALGLSDTGAAMCATDGRGPHASLFKWRHGSAQAIETRFDLLKDSLPALQTLALPLAEVGKAHRLRMSMDAIAPPARALVASALQALA